MIWKQDGRQYDGKRQDKTRLSEIQKNIDELYDKIDNLRCERAQIKTKGFDYIGKYIKYNRNDWVYMYVYDVFPTSDEKILIRGVAFREFQCKEWDGSYFGWETDCDFSVDEYEKDVITVITKEEYEKALNEAIDNFLKNKKEFVDSAMIKWAEYNKNCEDGK